MTLCVLQLFAAAPEPQVAVPGLTGLNVTPQALEFYASHLATQLTVRKMRVVTPAQLAAVMGLERQKAMMGCEADSACLTELADALGVEALLIGSVAHIDDLFQLNLQIIDAVDASVVVTYSDRVNGQKRLLAALDNAAKELARVGLPRLRARTAARQPVAPPPAVVKKTAPAAAQSAPAAGTAPSAVGASAGLSQRQPNYTSAKVVGYTGGLLGMVAGAGLVALNLNVMGDPLFDGAEVAGGAGAMVLGAGLIYMTYRLTRPPPPGTRIALLPMVGPRRLGAALAVEF